MKFGLSIRFGLSMRLILSIRLKNIHIAVQLRQM